MKITNILIIGLLSFAACGTVEVGESQRPTGDEIWENPYYPKDSIEADKRICYMTGLDYPKDYNWRNDSEAGSVKCSLTVFADGRTIMKVPVGNSHFISSDSDRHRVIYGHLYTDFCTDSETIIKKDGKEIFRFAGNESIKGMAVKGEDVFTLGQPGNGQGFTYRKNGITVLENDKGKLFPDFKVENDSIFFSFSEPVESATDRLERYYHVEEGRIRQVAMREDVKKVWDIIRHGSRICYLSDMTGISSPVLVNGDDMKALDLPDYSSLVSARILSAGSSIFTEAVIRVDDPYKGVYFCSGLWKEGAQYQIFSIDRTVSAICTCDDGICCVLNSSSSKGGGTVFRCGETTSLPYGYTSMGNNPMVMVKGILNIGLTAVNGGQPVVWKDGKTEELDLNGIICTMTYH